MRRRSAGARAAPAALLIWLASVAVVLQGCHDQGLAIGPTVTDPAGAGTYTLRESVITLQEGSSTVLQDLGDGRLRLSGAAPALERGSVLLVAEGGGLAAKILDVAGESGSVVVDTEPASIEDVLAEADLHVSGYAADWTLEPDPGVTVTESGTSGGVRGFSSSIYSKSCDVEVTLYKGKAEGEDVELKLDGEVTLAVPVEADIQVSLANGVESFDFAFGLEATVDVGLSLKLEEDITKKLPISAKKRHRIGTVRGAPIPVGPLTFVPEGEAFVQFETTAKARTGLEASYKIAGAKLMVGVEYRRAWPDGDGGWRLKCPDLDELSKAKTEVDIGGEVELEQRLSLLGVSGKFKLWSFAGPSGDVAGGLYTKGTGSLRVHQEDNLSWTEVVGEFDVGRFLEASANVELGLTEWEPKWSWELPVKYTEETSMPGYPVELKWPLTGAVPVTVD